MKGLTTLQLLERLVSIDSTSDRSNLEISDFICDYLDRSDISVERFPKEDGKVNIVATCGEISGTREGLVLSGHMDTVPAKEAGWTTNPFELTPSGERLYGRGTADMKGFLAAAVNVAVESLPLDYPLVLVLTCDEELGCLGSKALIDAWPSDRQLPRACLIGEPTSLRVIRMHKGHTRVRITVRGQGAHSAYPHLGSNAIEKAGGVIESLRELREELQAERPAGDSLWGEVPFVPFNIGMVTGGSAINIVPDECVLDVGFRLLPGMSLDRMMARVERAVSTGLKGDAAEVRLVNDSPAMSLSEDSSFCRAACEIVGTRETGAVSFATDAGWLQNLGLECILLGPGSIEVAHRADEFIPSNELTDTTGVLERLVDHFCRRG